MTNLKIQPGVTLNLFYDAPEQPEGIFDEFLAITPVSKDVSVRSFLSLIQSTPSDATSGQRYGSLNSAHSTSFVNKHPCPCAISGSFNTVSVRDFTPEVMDVILSEVTVSSASITPYTPAYRSNLIHESFPSAHSASGPISPLSSVPAPSSHTTSSPSSPPSSLTPPLTLPTHPLAPPPPTRSTCTTPGSRPPPTPPSVTRSRKAPRASRARSSRSGKTSVMRGCTGTMRLTGRRWRGSMGMRIWRGWGR